MINAKDSHAFLTNLQSSTAQSIKQTSSRITVAFGDGVGPDLMKAVLRILEKSDARLSFDTVEIGEKVYQSGSTAGIRSNSWDILRDNKVFLKAPITTPQGGGFKSLNVTVRKGLGLFANIRPCQDYAPFVPTLHPGMDVVIIRENEEDLYAGIEHRQTDEVFQCLKLISRPGTERLIRYGFEYARKHNRKKVSCFTKDNIMKMTDGLFHQVFEEIGKEYPELEQEHLIVDIGAARLADQPNIFDVVILPNLYGDILSDVAAEIAGSVGLAGSANIGVSCSMFEAIHGSAPRLAGLDRANPSGLLMASIQMLNHLGQVDIAQKIHNAWLKTIEDGVHTKDIESSEYTKKVVGTQAFADAIIQRLGEEPARLKPVRYFQPFDDTPTWMMLTNLPKEERYFDGIDVFLYESQNRNPETLASRLIKASETLSLNLSMISNRGVKVWPDGLPETFCTDHWRCRFMAPSKGAMNPALVWMLFKQLTEAGIDVIKTENLYTFGDKKGYSLGQGQ